MKSEKDDIDEFLDILFDSDTEDSQAVVNLLTPETFLDILTGPLLPSGQLIVRHLPPRIKRAHDKLNRSRKSRLEQLE